MPELPEVETVRRGLKRLLVGRHVRDIKILNPKSFQAASTDVSAFLIGAEISDVRRRAKVLLIDLASGYSLVIHLKMTGQIVFRGRENWAGGHPTDSFLAQLPDKSSRVVFSLSDLGNDSLKVAQLFFNDQRKFGWIKLMPTMAIETLDFMKQLGPEPLTGQPYEEFLRRIRRHNKTAIKAALLNQTVVAGIGNIYADESLWAAQVHPASRVGDLNDKQLGQILAAAIEVMKLSIKKGGSTDRNYVDAEGKKGSYLAFANVFRRQGQACPRCGSTIEKIRLVGRGTHICPVCQKLQKP
jgi:formamidopyrimidine-DNA glycosylase